MSWLSDLLHRLGIGKRPDPIRPPPPAFHIPPAEPTAVEAELLRLHNAARAVAHLPALSVHVQLSGAARFMADYQATIGKMTHDGPPQALGVADRLKAAGYDYGWASENAGEQPALPNPWIGPDPRTLEWMMQGWMNDPPHRANILDPQAVHFGAALAIASDGSRYFTCVFARLLA